MLDKKVYIEQIEFNTPSSPESDSRRLAAKRKGGGKGGAGAYMKNSSVDSERESHVRDTIG